MENNLTYGQRQARLAERVHKITNDILDEAEKRGFSNEEVEAIPAAIEAALKEERREGKAEYKREKPAAEAAGHGLR